MTPADNMPTTIDDIEHPLMDRLNMQRFIFCPGCLIGTVILSITNALKENGLSFKDYAIVSGIGCTGRSSGCFKGPAFHTTHGRAIPFATGIKLANPRLKVIVLSGDGDLFAIGGNHFIHAARRNVEITVLCINNNIYGMTGGQVAPTTQIGDITQTTPYGNVEPPFNLVSLAAAAGATYVARWPGYDTIRLQKSLLKSINNNGFSFIEVLAPCFIQYGSKNKLGDAIEILDWLKQQIK
ncbi:MAG: thiamine pyrophosphate-dependent enzyme, partial [Promethearchaeota archaeon]